MAEEQDEGRAVVRILVTSEVQERNSERAAAVRTFVLLRSLGIGVEGEVEDEAVAEDEL